MKTILACLSGGAALIAFAPVVCAAEDPAVEVSQSQHHDTSPPLRYLAGIAPPPRMQAPHAVPIHLRPGTVSTPPAAALASEDGALQSKAGPLVATTDGLNFAGVGDGDYGFSDTSAPPDTDGAVGSTQYVQIVNQSLAVFDKTTGAIVLAPKQINVVWAGFGGGCELNNDGDPIVKYDRIANRWVITQFSVSLSAASPRYLECVAVSQTDDATGVYNRYAFSYGKLRFDDYPKIGVWPDAYYVTYNVFDASSHYLGDYLCALDRTRMLAGAAASQQCYLLPTRFFGVLPADLDGATLPPAGAPNYMIGLESTYLALFKFHVDWTTPANSTLHGPLHINVPAYASACGGGTCIPQSGTGQRLDSLADRLMYRLAYRNFGDHQSLVVNHSVVAGTGVGVRWYELRNPDGLPAVFQTGTFAPGVGLYRWMGSIAMDKVGDIALGYSVSSPSMFPSIDYTGRVPTDPLGTLGAEKLVKAGGGSQNSSGLSRWGDYSAMALDPADDCTFYYTTEYLKTSGSFNWSTQINSFKFPGCQ